VASDIILMCPQCGVSPKKPKFDSNGRSMCPVCESSPLEAFDSDQVERVELYIALIRPGEDKLDEGEILSEITFVSFPRKRITESHFEQIVKFVKETMGLVTPKDI